MSQRLSARPILDQTVLNTPYGGELRELLLAPADVPAATLRAASLPGWDLGERQLCDLELLLSGGFSPLTGFLGEADYRGVVDDMRLADGTLWPLPITLDVPEELGAKLAPGAELALRDPEGVALAILDPKTGPIRPPLSLTPSSLERQKAAIPSWSIPPGACIRE